MTSPCVHIQTCMNHTHTRTINNSIIIDCYFYYNNINTTVLSLSHVFKIHPLSSHYCTSTYIRDDSIILATMNNLQDE